MRDTPLAATRGYRFDMNPHTQANPDANLMGGPTLSAQFWIRDPKSPGAGGLTNALELVSAP